MGAKALFAAAVAGDPRSSLLAHVSTADAAASLAQEWLGGKWAPGEPTTLDDGIYPSDGVTALRLPGVDVLGGERVYDWIDKVPPRVESTLQGRDLVVMQMHSVNDSLTFVVWRAGTRVRAVAAEGASGTLIEEGDRVAAELPFWNGERALSDEYPLPFSPLDLGSELIRATLGFVHGGMPVRGDVEPTEIPMFACHPAAAPPPAKARKLFRRG